MKKGGATLVLIQSSKTAADLSYICGIQLPEMSVVIQTCQQTTVISSPMEQNRLRRTVKKNITVIDPQQIGSTWKKGPVDWIQKMVPEKEIDVMPDFPISFAEELKQKGFQIAIKKETPCPQRALKTKGEIKSIQQTQRAAVFAMRAAIQQIASATIDLEKRLRTGKVILTSELVRATIGHILIDQNCRMGETIVSCGSSSTDPHDRGTGPLLAGQPIVIDIFPKSNTSGYWGDLTRTVCRGAAPDWLKKQYNTVKAAQETSLKAVKAGAWTDMIHNIGAELMESRGFQTETLDDIPQGFIHGTGHGVGLEIHEEPTLSASNHQRLKVGHIITIEPGLYYPGRGGVRIEDTILVTQEGYKMLATCVKRLEV